MTAVESAEAHMEALLAFHAVLGAVEDLAKTETADTGKYTYRYVALPAVLDEVQRACRLFGLELTQTPSALEGMLALHTRLIHKNGGEVNFEPCMLPMPRDAQPYGSALTYLRRYSLLTIFGIATEDDDGQAATVAGQTAPGRRTEAERMIRESMGTMDEAMRTKYVAAFKEQYKSSLSDLPAAKHGDALTWSREWIKAEQADQEFVAEAKGTASQREQAADDLAHTATS